jgi:transcriptional regulator with XRE-family HTH domain
MSSTALIVRGIKSRLKARGMTYRELAARLGVSEPTIKRDLGRGNFSLQRLDRICDALGVGVADLVTAEESSALTELSEQQEQALVTNPRALVVSYLIVNDWKFDEIVSTFQFDANELVSILLKLDKLRIVDFRPPNRMRKLTARNFGWRKDGAVQDYFLRRVIPEFFNARFDVSGDEFRFVAGMLSGGSMLRLQASIRRLAAEFEQLAHQDTRLPLAERDGCSAILALRSWEFSEFSKLRRTTQTRRGNARIRPLGT